MDEIDRLAEARQAPVTLVRSGFLNPHEARHMADVEDRIDAAVREEREKIAAAGDRSHPLA